MKKDFILAILIFLLIPAEVFALNAHVETVEGLVIEVSDFSMDGRRAFSIDSIGGIGKLDWKDLSSFEIRKVGSDYWVDVQYVTGKKESFNLRQFSVFRGRSDFGWVSIPFGKTKKVILSTVEAEGGKKEDPSQKGEAGTSSRWLDRVTLRNGDVLVGDLLVEALAIRTIFGTASFKKEDIQKIYLGLVRSGKKETEKDTLLSKYGDKLTGVINGPFLKLKLRTEEEVSIPRQHIQEIEFRIPEIDTAISTPSSVKTPARDVLFPSLQQKPPSER